MRDDSVKEDKNTNLKSNPGVMLSNSSYYPYFMSNLMNKFTITCKTYLIISVCIFVLELQVIYSNSSILQSRENVANVVKLLR